MMTKINNLVNTIHQGDCLEILDSLEKGSVDLAYLDPPFLTEKRHSLKTLNRNKEFCYICGSRAIYRKFLSECICKVKVVLKKTSTIFVHCDNNANHIIRSILDKIFGTNNFRSEII